ncbi:MAG: ABC transporter permease [Fidelibacterota bacterium]|nr:MAG: ABC transporter permease [Candidatus Neomarinimicrobiota bacterium]
MIGKLWYLIGEGIRSLWRTRLPTLGSTLTIALTLVIFGGAYIVLSNLDRATRRLQTQYRIDVFFNPLLNNQEAFQVYQQLKNVEGIASTEFISKEHAADIFKREFGEDVTEVLGTNPLNTGAIVLVARGYRTARRINRIADEIANVHNVDDVAYRGELVRLLERYLQFAVYSGLALGVIVLLGAVFLVSNTIKLSIYAKRNMIDILYLLGATRKFIRFPFLVEGALQGLIGSVFAFAVVVGLLDVVNYVLEQFVLYRVIRPPYLSMGLAIMGIALGLIGSSRGIRKFLNPKALQTAR